MKWYLKVLKNYTNFKGRARRKEYWMFILFNSIISFALIISGLIFAYVSVNQDATEGGIILGALGLYLGYYLLTVIPGLSVTVRRLHDIGKSGWMVFIILIPVVGAIWLLILLLTDSEQGKNTYGTNPKEVTLE